MKKGFVMFLFVLGLVALGGNVFAANGYYVDPSAFYMHTTDVNGGTNVVSTFNLDQQPWLRLHMPEAGYKIDTAAWWSNGGASFLNNPDSTTGNDTWLTIGNWNSLTAAQKTGLWKVDSSYSILTINGSNVSVVPGKSGAAYFNVLAPEPISALLFLLGGAGLGLKRFSLKKKV